MNSNGNTSKGPTNDKKDPVTHLKFQIYEKGNDNKSDKKRPKAREKRVIIHQPVSL